MLDSNSPNVDPVRDSAINFLGSGNQGNNPPNIIVTPGTEDGRRYPIKLLAIGIPEGVTHTIQELHVRRFAEVSAWSPAMKAREPGEIIRIMTRYFVINP